MISHRRVAVITFALATAVVAGCKKTPPPAPVVPVVTINQDSIDIDRRNRLRADSVARAESARRMRQQQVDDSIRMANEAAAAAARDAESMRATIGTTVNYEFDKADLREDTRQALDAKIPILNANPALTIRIAGHTDSRGSGEYNLQLGQRRAAAARDYLAARGVAASRIELVSYGEERPACQSMDEGCWAQNRRAEFEITAGGSPLRRP
ncbi:MAG: OmpA family protein [Gemmatimonadaceae bacterium]